MNKQKLIKGGVICAFCMFGGGIFSLVPQQTLATDKPITYEYALVFDQYQIEGYNDDVVVTAPNGENVDVIDGAFMAMQYGGTYVIEYNATITEVYVYQEKPTVTTTLVGITKECASVGEKVVFPSAQINSGIAAVGEYEYYLTFVQDGEEIEKMEPLDCEHIFTQGGEYTVEYRYIDVFGDEMVAKSFEFEILSEKTVIANSLVSKIGVNSTLSLKNIVGYYQGVEYPAVVYVKKPSESEYVVQTSNSLQITETGDYKVKGVSLILGDTVEKEFTISSSIVASSLISNPKLIKVMDGGTVPYYSSEAGKESLVVENTADGATFTYAKIIDTSKLTKNDNLISFEVDSTMEGATLSEMRVRLVDAHDPTNFIGMYVWDSPWNDQASFMISEYNKYQPGKIYEYISEVMIGTVYNGEGYLSAGFGKETYPFTLQYDAAEKALYTHILGAREFMRYLADPQDKDAWGGFTSNEAYLEITFVRGVGRIHILELAGEPITGDLSTYSDENAIFFSGNFSETLHDGAVGYSYSLPAPVKNKLLQENVEMSLKLGSNDVTDLVVDNVFTPTQAGEYCIEYKVTDVFGNLIEKSFSFNIKETPNAFIWSNESLTVRAMEYLEIPNLLPTSGNGDAEISATLVINGEESDVKIGREYRITSTDAKLKVTATDEIGYTETHEYMISVEAYAYIAAEKMPKVVRAGEEIIFPEAMAVDFTKNQNDSDYILDYTISVDGVQLAADRKYIVPTDKESISVTYNAQNCEKTYDLVILPAEIEQASGFILTDTEGTVEVKNFLSGAEFLLTEDTCLTMPYALASSRPSLSFSILRDGEPFDKIQVILTEKGNESKQVIVEFADLWGTPTIQVLGHERKVNFEYSDGTYGEIDGEYNEVAYRNFSFAYSNVERRIITNNGMMVIDVQTLANGKSFDGFEGGVYMSLQTVGISGDSSLIISSVCNQSMAVSSRGADRFGAEVAFEQPFASGLREIGTTLTVPVASAYDVLSRVSTVQLTMRSPDGTNQSLNADTANDIVLDKYGTYRFVYTTTDGVGITTKTTIVITVLDLVAPTLEVKDLKTEYKLGDELVLPTVQYSDNVSTEDSLKVNYLLCGVDGSALIIKDGKYTFQKAGDHKLVIVVQDEEGNLTMKKYVITVR